MLCFDSYVLLYHFHILYYNMLIVPYDKYPYIVSIFSWKSLLECRMVELDWMHGMLLYSQPPIIIPNEVPIRRK